VSKWSERTGEKWRCGIMSVAFLTGEKRVAGNAIANNSEVRLLSVLEQHLMKK
jgi:hypothetical protein